MAQKKKSNNLNEKRILIIESVKIIDWNAFELIIQDIYRRYPYRNDGDEYELSLMKLPSFPEKQHGIVFHGNINFGTRGILGFLPLPSDNTLYRIYIRAETRPLTFVDKEYSNEVSNFVEAYLEWMGVEISKLFPRKTLATAKKSSEKAIERHKKAWKEIKKTRVRYKKLYDRGEVEYPNPKLEDYVSAINDVLDRPYVERTVRSIIAKGDAGELDQ